MPRLTPISSKTFDKFLRSVGCKFARQEGDHLVYTRMGLKRPLVVPKVKDIPVFIIINNLRVLGISNAEYLDTLKKL